MSDTRQKRIDAAAAIKYSKEEDDAPTLVAFGKGEAARKMVDVAAEHHVPVVKDEALTKALSSLGVGDEIPMELYEVVAQVLVFISQADESYKKRFFGDER